MAGVTMTLKRVDQKGHICFEVPEEPELQEQLRKVLRACRDKNNDYVAVTMERPYSPRTTGPKSQNHHLNGHLMQLAQHSGYSYDEIKYLVKMTAAEQFGYPTTTVGRYELPKPEHLCNTEECAMLIEAAHFVAAYMRCVLREEN